VDAVVAHQAGASSVLVRDDAPPVDLLLVDPAVTGEGLADDALATTFTDRQPVR